MKRAKLIAWMADNGFIFSPHGDCYTLLDELAEQIGELRRLAASDQTDEIERFDRSELDNRRRAKGRVA